MGPDLIDTNAWRKSLLNNYAFVAVKRDDNKIIGFADLTAKGYLLHGYVHKDYQEQGIGSALLEIREKKAKELGIKKLLSEISITAKSFFEKHGYKIEKEQIKVKSNVQFINFLVIKKLIE